MAFAGEAPPQTIEAMTDQARAGIDGAIAAKLMNPFCSLCKAGREEWTFEVAELPGKRLADVMPELKRQEAEQLRKQAAFKAQERAARN